MPVECYPPPAVWRRVDVAAERAGSLRAEGRELDFRVEDSGRLAITLLEGDAPVRPLSVLEALTVAAGAPL